MLRRKQWCGSIPGVVRSPPLWLLLVYNSSDLYDRSTIPPWTIDMSNINIYHHLPSRSMKPDLVIGQHLVQVFGFDFMAPRRHTLGTWDVGRRWDDDNARHGGQFESLVPFILNTPEKPRLSLGGWCNHIHVIYIILYIPKYLDMFFGNIYSWCFKIRGTRYNGIIL